MQAAASTANKPISGDIEKYNAPQEVENAADNDIVVEGKTAEVRVILTEEDVSIREVIVLTSRINVYAERQTSVS
jgi:hypothetical protein